MLEFIRKELSFLLALATLIILLIFGSSSFIAETILVETLLFFIVFSVIVFAAMGVVSHAEKLAHRFGEPYGTMILTFSAVTVEIIMVTTMMLHGDADPTVNVEESRAMVRKLQALHVDVKYTEYPGVNHNSWDNAFAEPTFLSWMFAHRRP